MPEGPFNNVVDSQPDVAASHVNIGTVLGSMEKYEEALVELKKGLDVLVTVYGHEHPDVAGCYQNIAGVYYLQEGKQAQAIKMATKAYDINLKVLGPDHPTTKKLKSLLGK